MSNIAIRRAVLDDLDALSLLFDRYRQFQGKASDAAAARAFLAARIERGESVLFIAHDGDLAVGFAQLYPSFSSVSLSRVFILNDLFVDERGRRHGVASALLSALERHAWSLDAARVSLNVARDNVSAQQLYATTGWTQDEQYFMFHRFPPSS